MKGVSNTAREYSGSALARWISVSARSALAVLLLVILGSCRQSARAPVTLTYFRPGWAQPDPAGELLSRQFTRETGIGLKNLPVPESTLDTMVLTRRLLQDGGSGPDVLFIDVIWPGVLGADLIDLRPYLADEISSLEPQLMPGYTVDGKIVALPYAVQAGVLEYRTDLLREYGYNHPPRTWDELERMAARIQAGERAKGKKDFWGYVWQGADGEALTCNALEWQTAEGGGRIIEADRTISVNNPAVIKSWRRAKRWIGWISPPSVLAYRELDSMNVFDSGEAAFERIWGGTTVAPSRQYRLLHWRASLPVGKTGYTILPAGPGGSFGTLGGAGLAVSRRSAHLQDAIGLVRFLIRAQIKSEEQGESSTNGPAQPEVYDLPSMPDQHNHSEGSSARNSAVVARPSSVAGASYEEVTRAYIGAVHSVLTGERPAPVAAAELEKQLVKITGFRTGLPQTADSIVR